MLLQLKNTILIVLFFLTISFAFAQNPYILKDEDTETVEKFEVLADKNYTFEQILTDSSLKFIENPALLSKEQIANHDYLWIRFLIQNNSPYSKKIYLRAYPFFHTKIYAYNKEIEKWEGVESGLEVVDYQRKVGFKPVFIRSNKIDSIFIKVKTSSFKQQPNVPSIAIHIQKESYFTNTESYIFTVWIVSIFILLFFFIYNFYIYYIFRDITYIYYLLIVFGGILYITSYFEFFNLILPVRIFNFIITENNNLFTFKLNNFFLEVSICLVLFGFVKFTISYLQLQSNYSIWAKLLNYLLYFITISTLFVSVVTISQIYYLFTLPVIQVLNFLALGIILLLLIVGVVSLVNGYKLASYFLLANGVPLVLILVFTFLIFNDPTDKQRAHLLPCLVLLTQTLSFAVALVARINLLKAELKEKQLQAEMLEKENEKMLARNKYIELENEDIIADMTTALNKETELRERIKIELNQKTELEQKIEEELNQKEELQAKLEANQRELTANALYLYQKNELLVSLQKQIENLSYKDTTNQNREGLKEIKSAITNTIQLDNDWDNFKLHFEQVHPNFFKELTEKYPTLTKNELRLSAYYHLNMSVKEIASLLNINPTSVHMAKSRLNKKMEAIDKGKIDKNNKK